MLTPVVPKSHRRRIAAKAPPTAAPTPPPLWEDAFAYPNGPLDGNGGWAGVVGDADHSLVMDAGSPVRPDETPAGSRNAGAVPEGTYASPYVITMVGTPQTLPGAGGRYTFLVGNETAELVTLDILNNTDGSWSVQVQNNTGAGDEIVVPLTSGVPATLTWECDSSGIVLKINGTMQAGWAIDASLPSGQTDLGLYSEGLDDPQYNQTFRMTYASVAAADAP
jgi:hypothetical protein